MLQKQQQPVQRADHLDIIAQSSGAHTGYRQRGMPFAWLGIVNTSLHGVALLTNVMKSSVQTNNCTHGVRGSTDMCMRWLTSGMRLQVLYMTGWAPHASQQKPARRGSATVSFEDLQDALKQQSDKP